MQIPSLIISQCSSVPGRFLLALTFALSLMSVSSCSSDDDTLGSYRRDIVTLVSDASGNISTLVTDAGASYSLTNSQQGYTANSKYRVLAYYIVAPEGDSTTATIGRYLEVLTFTPTDIPATEALTDPVEVGSIWRSSHYLNMRLVLLGSTGTHIFGGIDQGISTSDTGVRTLSIALYHDQNNDPLYYSRTAYLSCDLSKYADVLTFGSDSVIIYVREQSDSTFTAYKFAY